MILELLGLKRHCIKDTWKYLTTSGSSVDYTEPFRNNRFDTRDSLFVARVTEQQLHLR